MLSILFEIYLPYPFVFFTLLCINSYSWSYGYPLGSQKDLNGSLSSLAHVEGLGDPSKSFQRFQRVGMDPIRNVDSKLKFPTKWQDIPRSKNMSLRVMSFIDHRPFKVISTPVTPGDPYPRVPSVLGCRRTSGHELSALSKGFPKVCPSTHLTV